MAAIGALLSQADKGLAKSTLYSAIKFKKWMWIMNSTIAIVVSSGILVSSLTSSKSETQNGQYDPNETVSVAPAIVDSTIPEHPDTLPVVTEIVYPLITDSPPVPATVETLVTSELDIIDNVIEDIIVENIVDDIVIKEDSSEEASDDEDTGISSANECESARKPKKSIKGDGNIVKQTRVINGFNGIIQKSIIDVHFEQADEYSVVIEADQNLMDHIETCVKNKELSIEICGVRNIKPSQGITVWIKGPKLESVDSRGTGDIYIDSDLLTQDLTIKNHGTGDIMFSNFVSASTFRLLTNGTGDTQIKGELETKAVKIENNGTGDVIIAKVVSEDFNIKMNGTGDIIFKLNSYSETGYIENNGAGDFIAKKHETANMKIQMNGAGDVYINPKESLNIKMFGAGDVITKSKTPDFRLNKHGVGSVIVKQ